METTINTNPILEDRDSVVLPEQPQRNPFILGNTVEIGYQQLSEMLTPVFSRDNVETISHTEGISTVMDAVSTFFDGEQINNPIIRVSHEMKLKNRYGQHLETDSYFQRMMAMIEIPSISANINGSQCHLQVCIVRNYADCNLLGNSSQFQSWSVVIGALNTICTNGLIRTEDGCNFNIKVTNTGDLYKQCIDLFQHYDYKQHIDEMRRLNDTTINISDFAQFLGRARMASQMPPKMKKELGIPEFILPESQINQMVRDYYTDEAFGSFGKELTAWNFYMLLTNYKNNMIDLNLQRLANAYTCSKGIAAAVNHESDEWNWFIQ